MALITEENEPHDTSASPAQHLGKRKRSYSPETDGGVNPKYSSTEQDLKDALLLIKRYDPLSEILKFPLPNRAEDNQTVKRQRIENLDRNNDTIESRISRAAYGSIDDLMNDLSDLRGSIVEKDSTMNGIADASTSIKDQLTTIWEHLQKDQSQGSNHLHEEEIKVNTNDARDDGVPALPNSQIITLRSQTEHGIRQLFSGLPRDGNSINIDGRNLPNGFELTDVLTIDKNDLRGKDARKFGDIFAPHRSIKSLEMPRTISRPSRGACLTFVPPFENITNPNRNDYRATSLETGRWLKYAIPEQTKSDNGSKANDNNARGDMLFKSAFSTFAPTSDNSHSVINEFDKSQQWWRKHGRTRNDAGIHSLQAESEIGSKLEMNDEILDNELEELITNFIPADDQTTECEKILDEISELLEMLSSYQTMRSLEVARGPSSASKPTKDEFDTFDLLHSQLKLLISNLPPFAVAKLDGSQLEKLNISTQILISPPEFVGIAQADDYTLRRTRANQAATTAAGRNTAQITSRPAYGTPASAYNAQARAYNNLNTPAYVARPQNSAMYGTPRHAPQAQNGPFPTSQTQPNGPTIHTPSIQQFQRPTMNGYGSTAATPSHQSSYMQRPSQPSYQQRAQDSAMYNRIDPSRKPAVNGDVSHPTNRPYIQQNGYGTNTAAVATPQRAAPEVSQTRQSSGTPQPSRDAMEATMAAAL